MLRLAFDFIITWRETRTRPNAYERNTHEAECLPDIFILVNTPFFFTGANI